MSFDSSRSAAPVLCFSGTGSPHSEPMFFQNSCNQHHTLMIGKSGQGKSFLFAEMALQLGIPVDEVIKNHVIRLTPEEICHDAEQQFKERNQLSDLEKRRSLAVREAFWDNTPDELVSFDNLYDALVCEDLVAQPSKEQVKKLFLMLPDYIFGLALAWSFSDTEVREKIHEFVHENKVELKKLL